MSGVSWVAYVWDGWWEMRGVRWVVTGERCEMSAARWVVWVWDECCGVSGVRRMVARWMLCDVIGVTRMRWLWWGVTGERWEVRDERYEMTGERWEVCDECCEMSGVGWVLCDEWCEMSGVGWVLCDEWCEMSGVRWVVCDEWCEMSDQRWVVVWWLWGGVTGERWLVRGEWYEMNDAMESDVMLTVAPGPWRGSGHSASHAKRSRGPVQELLAIAPSPRGRSFRRRPVAGWVVWVWDEWCVSCKRWVVWDACCGMSCAGVTWDVCEMSCVSVTWVLREMRCVSCVGEEEEADADAGGGRSAASPAGMQPRKLEPHTAVWGVNPLLYQVYVIKLPIHLSIGSIILAVCLLVYLSVYLTIDLCV